MESKNVTHLHRHQCIMSVKDFIQTYSHNLSIKAENLTPQAAYYTNGMGFAWGALTFNEWMMLITLLLGVLTFFVNIYFQWKRNKRERELQEMRKESHSKDMRDRQ